MNKECWVCGARGFTMFQGKIMLECGGIVDDGVTLVCRSCRMPRDLLVPHAFGMPLPARSEA